MNTKAIVIIGGIMFIGVGYWLMSEPDEDSSGKPKLTINALPKLGKQTVEVTQISKTEAYEKAAFEEKEMEKKFAIDTSISVTPVASAVTKVMASKFDERIKQVKENRSDLVAVYNGKKYTPESNSPTSEPEVQTMKDQNPKRMAASITAISTPKKVEPKTVIVKDSINLQPVKRRTKKIYNDKEVIPIESVETETLASDNQGQNNSKQSQAAVLIAAIYGDQVVKQGSPVRFRLMREVVYKGIKYPKNTILTGKSSFGQDRLFVVLNALPNETGTQAVSVNFALHDTDLNEGINANLDLTKQAVNQESTNMGLDMLASTMGSTGGATGLIASGASQIARRSATNTTKVFIHDGDPVQFVEVTKK